MALVMALASSTFHIMAMIMVMASHTIAVVIALASGKFHIMAVVKGIGLLCIPCYESGYGTWPLVRDQPTIHTIKNISHFNRSLYIK